MIDDDGDSVVRGNAHESVGRENSGAGGGKFSCTCAEFGNVGSDAQATSDCGRSFQKFAAANTFSFLKQSGSHCATFSYECPAPAEISAAR